MTRPLELVVISGKGGTGKTSVVAAFAALAGGAVLADCDVDAADLHLVLRPELGREHDFSRRHQAVIDHATCTSCGRCAEVCRFAAVLGPSAAGYDIDTIACEGCGLCARVCPEKAISMEPVVNGAWMTSETRFGPLVHARLGIAEDNSGKLVTLVRNRAREVAAARGLPLVIVDGAPGIGCPVIASLTGADLVLAVTEPTVSGRHVISTGPAGRQAVPAALRGLRQQGRPESRDGVPDSVGGFYRRRALGGHHRLRPVGDSRAGGRRGRRHLRRLGSDTDQTSLGRSERRARRVVERKGARCVIHTAKERRLQAETGAGAPTRMGMRDASRRRWR
jgi:MinD superfamily P-loop ATPase